MFPNLKTGIWLLCVAAWVFGAIDRGVAALSHRYLSMLDLTQVFTTVFFLVGWLFLKPKADPDT